MAQMFGDADHYQVLGVSPQADDEAIRQAYRKLARSFHPDVAGDAGVDMMKRINAAYHVLGDPARRRDYDERRNGAFVPQPGPRSRPPQPAGPLSRPLRGRQPPQPSRGEGPMRLYRQIDLGDGSVAALAFAHHDDMLGLGCSDGRIEIWRLAQQRKVAHFTLGGPGEATRAGVLSHLRLSPDGDYALAWGLSLGTRAWHTHTGDMLWTAALNAPGGAMDAILLDSPALMRLALPAASMAMAEDDPFHWVEEGRTATDIQTRALSGPNGASWLAPIRCPEPIPARPVPGAAAWRVHLRFLAQDGNSLVTFATGPAAPAITNASMAHLWDLHASRPVLMGSVVIPGRVLWYPIAFTANAAVIATQFEERGMRLYQLHTGQHVSVPTGPVPSDARVTLSPDGALMAIIWPEARRGELWSTSQGQRVQTWSLGAQAVSVAIAVAQSAPLIAIGRSDGICEIWSAL